MGNYHLLGRELYHYFLHHLRQTLRTELKYIELKSGFSDNGNYFELESGDEYWISGVKKDMSDRHQFGGGKILVEKRIVSDYLQTIGRTELPKSGYELTEVETEKPIERITELENSQLEKSLVDESVYTKTPKEFTNDELEFLIEKSIDEEKNVMYNKGKRSN